MATAHLTTQGQHELRHRQRARLAGIIRNQQTRVPKENVTIPAHLALRQHPRPAGLSQGGTLTPPTGCFMLDLIVATPDGMEGILHQATQAILSLGEILSLSEIDHERLTTGWLSLLPLLQQSHILHVIQLTDDEPNECTNVLIFLFSLFGATPRRSRTSRPPSGTSSRGGSKRTPLSSTSASARTVAST